jgi:hypothetical protein
MPKDSTYVALACNVHKNMYHLAIYRANQNQRPTTRIKGNQGGENVCSKKEGAEKTPRNSMGH